MDFATIIGLIVGTAVVVVAMLLGGSLMAFVDVPSILIVIAGGFSATLIRFPLKGILRSLAIGGRVSFTDKTVEPRALISQIAEMADLVRRQGPIALETLEIDEPNLSKGAQFIADGYDGAFIKDSMELNRDQFLTRLSEGKRVFKSLGDAAPAFGMIGTLVGLVQMLGNMDDPSKIGPAMAVALLTTLYGAVIANLVCLPIADKLGAKLDVEEINQSLVIDGVMAIKTGLSPVLVRERLSAYLPEHLKTLPEAA